MSPFSKNVICLRFQYPLSFSNYRHRSIYLSSQFDSLDIYSQTNVLSMCEPIKPAPPVIKIVFIVLVDEVQI